MFSVVNSCALKYEVSHMVMPSGYSSLLCILTVDQLVASNAHYNMHFMTVQLHHVTGVNGPPRFCQYLARRLAQSLFFWVNLIGGLMQTLEDNTFFQYLTVWSRDSGTWSQLWLIRCPGWKHRCMWSDKLVGVLLVTEPKVLLSVVWAK